jgi:hypothetical protein
MMHRFFNHAPRCIQLFALLLLAIVAIGWAPRAAAATQMHIQRIGDAELPQHRIHPDFGGRKPRWPLARPP